jgi:hypothetical protein
MKKFFAFLQLTKSLLFAFVIVNANVAFTIERVSTLAQCDVITNVVVASDVIIVLVVVVVVVKVD